MFGYKKEREVYFHSQKRMLKPANILIISWFVIVTKIPTDSNKAFLVNLIVV